MRNEATHQSPVLRSGRGGRIVVVATILAIGATVALELRPLAHVRISNVTWTEHVGPLLERRCVSCHAPGHAAQPPLAEYAQAVAAGSAIKRAVLQRSMPPWSAMPGFGEFENDHGLSSHEIDLLVSWIDGGMQSGPARRDSAPPVVAASLAGPDLMLDVGRDYPIDSLRRTYRVPIPGGRERWIRGWQFYPGNGALVRRARIGIAPGEWLGTWLPDEAGVFLAPSFGWRLPRQSMLTLEVEYGEPPAPASDRSHVGLFLSDRTRTPLQHMKVGRGVTTLTQHVNVVALTPTMAVVDQSMRVVASRPDGSIEPLLWIRNYDPRFARSYRLLDPILLPRGTRIEAWSFDGESSVDVQYAAASESEVSARLEEPRPGR